MKEVLKTKVAIDSSLLYVAKVFDTDGKISTKFLVTADAKHFHEVDGFLEDQMCESDEQRDIKPYVEIENGIAPYYTFIDPEEVIEAEEKIEEVVEDNYDTMSEKIADSSFVSKPVRKELKFAYAVIALMAAVLLAAALSTLFLKP